MEDLEACYPKLRKGGLVSGHDFVPDSAEIKSEFEKATEAWTIELSSLSLRLLDGVESDEYDSLGTGAGGPP